MTPERWQQVKEVLDGALELAPEQRPAFLDQACSTDHSLRQDVESLLESADAARSNFLPSSAGRITLPKGTRLGDCEVESLIGSGGMGEVYRARDRRLDREVAIKVLPSFLSSDSDRLRRFEQEARAAAALNHPNILAVHQMGTYEGAPYLVSELLDGLTLREHLRRGPLPIRKAVDYAIQIAHGLAAAHDKGIVHRDLKPENLFVTKESRIKILDFGLAKLTQPRPETSAAMQTHDRQTEPGIVMGTVGYMSPEQVRGEAAGQRADIFAFGAIFYEMLCGERAFLGTSAVEMMGRILKDDPPSVTGIVPAIPPGLQRIVQRCLQKHPDQRFRTASDLAFALESLSDARVPLASANQARPGWAVVSVGIALVLAAVTAFMLRPQQTPPKVTGYKQIITMSKGFWYPAVTDGPRLYLNGSKPPGTDYSIAQVASSGGEIAPINIPLQNPMISAISDDGSELLLMNLPNSLVIKSRYDFESYFWVLPLPGGSPRRLGSLTGHNPSWGPKGQLLFAKGNDLFVAEHDGSAPRKLLTAPGYLAGAGFSPDGSRIGLTVALSDASNEIWEARADGSGMHRLLPGWNNPPNEEGYGWTPDGNYMFFTSNRGGTPSIWILSERSSFWRKSSHAPLQLTAGPLHFFGAYPSKDGKKLFTNGFLGRGELVRYDARTGEFVPFLGGISASDVDFSRDGNWVTYVNVPERTLWRSRADGTERLQFTNPPMRVGLPHWSPDGQQIAFTGLTPGKGTTLRRSRNSWNAPSKLFLISKDGGVPTAVTATEDATEDDPTWSADGKSLAFGVFEDTAEKTFIQVFDLQTHRISKLPGSQGVFEPRWSPDGRYIVGVSHDDSTMLLIDLKTQHWRKLVHKTLINCPVWSADSHYVYFDDLHDPEQNPAYQRVNVANAKLETIVGLKTNAWCGTPFSPGSWTGLAPGDNPLFCRYYATTEIYALDLQLP
jgi:serine/threonine protein kinase/Tol biopolymer transport system component